MLCTMLDAALTCAIHTTLPQRLAHPSIELKDG
jgi:acyl-coenzyme A thioesterase PaaI-like protein